MTVINGRRAAQTWRIRVEEAEPVLTGEAVERVAAAATTQLAGRDRHELATAPPQPSIERAYRTVLGCFIAAIVGTYVLLLPLSQTLYWVALATACAQIALGLYARRYHAFRLAADAWLTAVAGISAFAMIALAVT